VTLKRQSSVNVLSGTDVIKSGLLYDAAVGDDGTYDSSKPCNDEDITFVVGSTVEVRVPANTACIAGPQIQTNLVAVGDGTGTYPYTYLLTQGDKFGSAGALQAAVSSAVVLLLGFAAVALAW
jgi:hypothetical protein